MDHLLDKSEATHEGRGQLLRGLKHVATFIDSEMHEGLVSRGMAQRVRIQDTRLLAAAHFLTDCYRVSPNDTLELLLALDDVALGKQTDYRLTLFQGAAFDRAVGASTSFSASHEPTSFGTDDNRSHTQALSKAGQSAPAQWTKRDLLRLGRNAGAAAVVGGLLGGVPVYREAADAPKPTARRTSSAPMLDDYFGLNGHALAGALITAGFTGSLSSLLVLAKHADTKDVSFRAVRNEAYNILEPLQAMIDVARAQNMVRTWNGSTIT